MKVFSVKFLLMAAMLGVASSAAAAPKVVASIKPVHALVAAVMDGVATPTLLLDNRASPHDFALKPSAARAINEADVVFWIGDALEGFLVRPLAAAPRVRSVELADAPNLKTLAPREGGVWEAHQHGAEAHGAHDHDEHEHEGEDEHGHHLDPHIWLDPANARAMAAYIVSTLSEVDAAHAERYRANGQRLDGELAALQEQLAKRVEAVRGRPYVVFHDAYQYFEARYGLQAVGSITVSPELKPSAQRLRAVREKIAQSGARCVFAEPQFDPALIATLIEGTPARAGRLDPLGVDVPAGPAAYTQTLTELADGFVDCLSH
ncbi:zinc ABC transporter substrate-binding protein ZnuA [Plasticicumulans acidivorans]|uniref:High-affinity zinc uptake system protein ZnuA n=1 Tax=Plasticicumulans acidivorans TaxID=886464 RepID=A0A317MT28_9GAMM|nr:zinc ABC transporter substrate-binding protein ZnuA [Plasticicumulans acidivorans]PWV60567.1 zinc transport system substrate-binding protein [Plasticicumulans acidivorans]